MDPEAKLQYIIASRYTEKFENRKNSSPKKCLEFNTKHGENTAKN